MNPPPQDASDRPANRSVLAGLRFKRKAREERPVSLYTRSFSTHMTVTYRYFSRSDSSAEVPLANTCGTSRARRSPRQEATLLAAVYVLTIHQSTAPLRIAADSD